MAVQEVGGHLLVSQEALGALMVPLVLDPPGNKRVTNYKTILPDSRLLLPLLHFLPLFHEHCSLGLLQKATRIERPRSLQEAPALSHPGRLVVVLNSAGLDSASDLEDLPTAQKAHPRLPAWTHRARGRVRGWLGLTLGPGVPISPGRPTGPSGPCGTERWLSRMPHRVSPPWIGR